jgi:hypothetical protein
VNRVTSHIVVHICVVHVVVFSWWRPHAQRERALVCTIVSARWCKQVV